MKPIPAEQLAEGLSSDLQDLLVREAFIRARRARIAAEIDTKRSDETKRAGTRPAFLMFRKEAKEDFKVAAEQLRAEIVALERELASCDLILKKCDRIISAEVETFLDAQSASFRHARAAQGLVTEWRAALGLYGSCLKRFIMALGIARNQMASGYDRKAGKFAPGTLEAFGAALAAAKSLEAEAAIPNKLARRQREFLALDLVPEQLPEGSVGLPYVAGGALVKRVSELATATLESAAAQISAMIDSCEQLHVHGIPALLEENARNDTAQQAERARQVAAPLGEIRVMADGAVDDARMSEVVVAMEARFVTLTG